MDWSAVTAEDLVDALREVDWSTPPRPVPEFFSRFTVPRSYSKWTSRLKCNLYYYRTNYFILIMFILGIGFLWKPVAILAAFMTGLSIAFLNDSFAVTFNEKVTRTVRQFSPHLAAKMRPPITPVLRGRPSSKRSIHICGRPRWVFVLFFSAGLQKLDFVNAIFYHSSKLTPIVFVVAVSCILWLTSCSLLTVLWALLIALFATVLHASFRTPNLKARLNTFREEFRAVWRNYSEL
ncbi:PRA1 family protein A1-like isoform X1 [Panicum virgatum]|uniref:PRA1 family protein A1-like isoform X1 n=1 Tax=Panicum virgatum TaxID=38727 RepID=UPI0019D5E3DD|nr:PRA1 family protein A1-like isoform X1 [Panicum virgatum]